MERQFRYFDSGNLAYMCKACFRNYNRKTVCNFAKDRQTISENVIMRDLNGRHEAIHSLIYRIPKRLKVDEKK